MVKFLINLSLKSVFLITLKKENLFLNKSPMELDYQEIHQRTLLLIGRGNLEKIRNSHVAVFGLGGVGGYALEAIARAGIGTITIVDYDKIEPSNLNRQILSSKETIGLLKVDVAEKRILSINPSAKVYKYSLFIDQQTLPIITNPLPQYAIDAIDTVPSKVELLKYLHDHNIFTVSCMGAGFRLNPLAVRYDDISKTHTCPLARSIRNELKKIGIKKGILCVFSIEPPINKASRPSVEPNEKGEKEPIGSISYVPGIIGLVSAGIILQKIIDSCN